MDLPMLSGVDPQHIHGPIFNDTIGKKDTWRKDFKNSDEKRRAACTDWDSDVPATFE